MPKTVKKTTRAAKPMKAALEQTIPATATAKPVPEGRLAIDYPQENETIWNGHYAVRITTTDCDGVDLSIDGQASHPCRNVAGHWWFDLRGLAAGSHLLTARLHKGGSDVVESRQFNVKE